MKKIIFITITSMLFLFSSSTLYAYEGIVIVLEAPLLKEEKLNSTVLQVLRKGSTVYIPNEIIDRPADANSLPKFIQTYDRVGNTAFILSKYIKIITNEINENEMPITLLEGDPTDYRIEEPIPLTYPFSDSTFLRASFSWTIGSNIKAPYDYNSPFFKQTFSPETGVKLAVTRKIIFDNYDRYYFGIVSAISSVGNSVEFINSNFAKEKRSLLKIGPIITFDSFKTDKLRFTLGTGFTYNYHKSTIQLSDSLGNSEQQIFSGYSLAPFLSSIVQVTNLMPLTDIILGSDFNLFLPHSQKAHDQVSLPVLWGTDTTDKISSGFKFQVAFFLGIQVKY